MPRAHERVAKIDVALVVLRIEGHGEAAITVDVNIPAACVGNIPAGRIDATQAAQRKSQVEARVTKLVNNLHLSSQRCQRISGGSAAKPGTGT